MKAPMFQGDVCVIPGKPFLMFLIAGVDPPEKHRKGGFIMHVGEKGDHCHVLEGDVQTLRKRQTLDLSLTGWDVTVGKGGAVLRHVDGKGKETKEHGTLVLEPGQWYVGTQREALGENEFTATTD